MLMGAALGQDQSAGVPRDLPFVSDFDAERYLGWWYEVARLPTRIQPPGTLAVAEYSTGEVAGQVAVRNSAYDGTGKRLSVVEGRATLAEGDPLGRLIVAFGPVRTLRTA